MSENEMEIEITKAKLEALQWERKAVGAEYKLEKYKLRTEYFAQRLRLILDSRSSEPQRRLEQLASDMEASHE